MKSFTRICFECCTWSVPGYTHCPACKGTGKQVTRGTRWGDKHAARWMLYAAIAMLVASIVILYYGLR